MTQFVVFMVGLLGSNLVLSSFFFFLGKEAGRREVIASLPEHDDSIMYLAEAVKKAKDFEKKVEEYRELRKQFFEDEE